MESSSFTGVPRLGALRLSPEVHDSTYSREAPVLLAVVVAGYSARLRRQPLAITCPPLESRSEDFGLHLFPRLSLGVLLGSITCSEVAPFARGSGLFGLGLFFGVSEAKPVPKIHLLPKSHGLFSHSLSLGVLEVACFLFLQV